MCAYCSKLELKEYFKSPKEYMNTISYIQELLAKKQFIFIEGNCELGKQKDTNGNWVESFIYHIIECPHCGQQFSCVANTYKGFGNFKKRRVHFSLKI